MCAKERAIARNEYPEVFPAKPSRLLWFIHCGKLGGRREPYEQYHDNKDLRHCSVPDKDHEADVYGTITHNRARGVHLLEPMKAIVKDLIKSGKTVQEISKQLGMKPEEIFRLSGFTREQFLDLMTKDVKDYSRAAIYKNVR